MLGLWVLICHGTGDYLLQTDHMASEKTKSLLVAFWHAVVYSLPFLLVTRSPIALAVICITHALIDRYRLARYLVWAKNQIAPATYRYPWGEAAWHGYKKDKPDWLAGWLLILADNVLHLAINAGAISTWP